MNKYTVDYESINGGIYRMRGEFATEQDAQKAVRSELAELSSYHAVFIADQTGRRILHGFRRARGRSFRGWAFKPATTMTRVQLHDKLVKVMGYEDTAY